VPSADAANAAATRDVTRFSMPRGALPAGPERGVTRALAARSGRGRSPIQRFDRRARVTLGWESLRPDQSVVTRTGSDHADGVPSLPWAATRARICEAGAGPLTTRRRLVPEAIAVQVPAGFWGVVFTSIA
jgi:hypothetical protein